MTRILFRCLCALTLIALLSGCDLLAPSPKPSAEPPAATMLPNLPGYTTVEGQTLTGYINKLSGGAALLSGNPELTVMLAAVDRVITCYQQVGAVRARVYSNQAQPLSAGAVAVADKKALLDPANFFKCVTPNVQVGAQSAQIEPCKANYTLQKDGNEYYILYAGTTREICQAFCKNLDQCTAHK